MKYSHLILICLIVAVTGFIIRSQSQESIVQMKDDFLEKYKPDNSKIENGKAQNIVLKKWLFDIRLSNYAENLDKLQSSMLNIAVLIVIGLLLIFYKPSGIEIPFISIRIPEKLLYIIVIFGSLYTWANFGQTFNAAIDSRLVLETNLRTLTGEVFFDNMKYDLRPTHILVDNAIVDNWLAYFFDFFKDPSDDNQGKEIYATLTLFGLYGTSAGILFAIIFVAPVEFKLRSPHSKVFSNIVLAFAFLLTISTSLVWINLHPYSIFLIIYAWLIAATAIVIWKYLGQTANASLSKELLNKTD